MNTDRPGERSLRPGPRELTRLAWALGLSLAVHLLGYGGYQVGRTLGIWPALQLPAWLQKTRMLAAPALKPPEEMPLVYVDVSARQSTEEPPKNTKFYSDKNSLAANIAADQDTGIPKIEGTQTQIAKTEDTPRSPLDKLLPEPRIFEEAKPKPAGDLAMYRPDPGLRPDQSPAEEPRPRTIKEALMRQRRTQLVGEKMKSEGGVKRLQLVPSLDAKQSRLGDYDREFFEVVQSRWYDLLDNLSYDGYRRGKVTLEFRLQSDGQITDIKVLDENVGTMLSLMCQKAVSDPAPYRKWEREMRLIVAKDYREMTLTFYYN